MRLSDIVLFLNTLWFVGAFVQFSIAQTNTLKILLPPDNRLSQSGNKLTALALEEAGVPVLMIDADMVDAQNWDRDRMVGMVADFLRDRGLT